MNNKKLNKFLCELITLCIVLGTAFGAGYVLKGYQIESNNNIVVENIKEYKEPTIYGVRADTIYNYILKVGIQHPEIVFRQVLLETGHFKSKIYFENQNLFGMKKAYKRQNVQTGVKHGHATYDHWRHSIDDYKLYQDSYCKNLSKEQYLAHLGKRYAEDKNYKTKLQKIDTKRYNHFLKPLTAKS